MTSVFVDFDGTITDRDTFDVLVRHVAGPDVWEAFEEELRAGRRTLRDTLAAQAAHVRIPREEAVAILHQQTTVDPTFAPFAERVRAAGWSIRIVSSGIASVIAPALARAGIDVPVDANDIMEHPDGWRMTFRDDSDNGFDKANEVRAAAARGEETIYCGDGVSDFDAALIAGRRFAKRGRALESHLRERAIPFTAFDSFAEVETALFS